MTTFLQLPICISMAGMEKTFTTYKQFTYFSALYFSHVSNSCLENLHLLTGKEKHLPQTYWMIILIQSSGIMIIYIFKPQMQEAGRELGGLSDNWLNHRVTHCLNHTGHCYKKFSHLKIPQELIYLWIWRKCVGVRGQLWTVSGFPTPEGKFPLVREWQEKVGHA